MSKFKLFLLAGLVSLIGIGSFTNAQFTTFGYSFVKTFSWESSNASCVSDCSTNAGIDEFIVPGNYKAVVSNSAGVSIKRIEYRCYNPRETNVFTFRGGDYYFTSHESYGQCLMYVIYDKLTDNLQLPTVSLYKEGEVEYLPVSTLSPVINGLSESINEFIPYVVYVGVGVLGVLIGFFAIKRLMNRVKRQSFGVFKSRKRK